MLPPSSRRDRWVSGSPRWFETASARLAVDRVLAVLRAELLQLEPVGVVAPVLAGDVVPALALLAGQGDLRTDVGGCHGALLALRDGPAGPACGRRPHDDGPRGAGSVESSGDRI